MLEIQGSVTLGPQLRTLYKRARRALKEEGCGGLVLNFAGVSKFDSAGIGELVRIHTEAAHQGLRVALAHANPRIREMLAITRVDALFTFADNEQSAIRAITSPVP